MSQEKVKVLYILSGGHSGSTVLSLILGAAPEVFNAGELKFYSKHADRNFHRWSEVSNRCLCGRDALECPFWAQVEQAAPDLEIAYTPGIRGYLKGNFTRLNPDQSETSKADTILFKQILETAKTQEPCTRIILDLSKNIPRYLQLKANPDLDVTAIYLVRDGRGYLNSYRKRHQGGGLRWLLQWAVLNSAILLHLTFRQDPYYKLSYDRFTQDPEKYLAEIRAEFGLSIPDNYVEAVNQTAFHLRAGNAAVIEKNTFAGLTHDTSWQATLPTPLRWFAELITFPLNRLFGV